tara:strand:- start:132 stop:392 length:261 start_codon:yes stop_codon:yes gene_type:complete
MKSICEVNSCGDKEWRINGLLHREDGPAVEYANGDKWWYLNNLLHRTDGPAVELINGVKAWYYHDKYISCKDNREFLRMIKLMVFL